MKPRYSLRLLLLLLLPAIGGLAFFWHLRGKPEKIARQFQVAVQTNDKIAADKLLSRAELKQAAEKETPIKQFHLQYRSFEYEPQSFDQMAARRMPRKAPYRGSIWLRLSRCVLERTPK